jgi:hypothetical protein
MVSTEEIRVIASKDHKKYTMTLRANGVMHVFVKEDCLVDIDDIKEGLEFVHSLGMNNRYLNLYEFSKNADVDKDAREWASSNTNNQFTVADAMLVKTMAHKIVGNFYLNFHKPVRPTRLFTDKLEALKWLGTFKDRIEM